MATNVRCKSSGPARTAQALARDPDILHIPARRRSTRPAPVADEAEVVRRRIKHLECVITTAPAEQLARRLAMQDIVPPTDEQRTKNQPKAAPRRRPMQAEAEARHRSISLLVQSVILAVVIAGVTGWLNQRFHFLHP